MNAAEQIHVLADAPIVEHAIEYGRRGWQVFPCRPADKRPFTINGFKDATADEKAIRQWWTQWPRAMIGVRMGAESGVWAIDPDAPKEDGDPDGRAAWAAFVTKHGAIHTHAHLTPGDGQHLLFKWCADRPVTNKEGVLKGTGINVRGEGGYIIAPPSRRQDGRAYEIAEPLDYFSFAEAPDWLYDLILAKPAEPSISQRAMALVRPRSDGSRRAYAEAALHGERDEVASTVHGRNNRLNDAAIKLGSLVGAGELSEGEVIGALYDASIANGYVASDGSTRTMATINSGLQAGIKTPRQIPDRAHHPERQQSQAEFSDSAAIGHHPSNVIRATPYVWKDPTTIPRREWLYGTHLIRRFGSGTIAHPGVGKSALEIAEALAMATGRDLLGVTPRNRCRVWYWNGEDPQEETDRRVAAACLHYKIGPAEIAGWLFTDSGREQEIILARQTRDGATIAEPVAQALIDTIRTNKIDVLIIDPFISSHRVTENDNNAIDVVAKKWTAIADAANCAIDLVHHSKKTGGSDVTVEDGRGAVALLAAVRSARVLNAMSEGEAEKHGLPARRAYFRVDNGKANLAPPADKADWFHIRSVSLGNGEPSNIMDTGDSVGVVTPWKLPDPMQDVTAADFDKAAQAIRAGKWRENAQALDWVGVAIARALDLQLTDTKDKAKVKAMIRAWRASGALVAVEGLDSKRMPRAFVEVASDD